jgi:hypothetical protein
VSIHSADQKSRGVKVNIVDAAVVVDFKGDIWGE